ncbi:MAG: WXG100 family type VII secretion target [Phycisphaerales bacterium]|jgi:uncharacterized protein YukE|nr:WXG100 family type VII secretion target [Phycisphaerales bacterium]MDP6987082.1 WXG100 family type VII secretion target [Phycisphaerales bacterium]
MAKAVADPEEIRRFAHDLKRFSDELTHQLQVMRARMSSLSQSWRDQEQRKFEEEFDHGVRAMDRLAKATAEQIPFLLRKAQRIEDYLQQR